MEIVFADGLVKMRSHWTREALVNDQCPYKKAMRRHRDTHTNKAMWSWGPRME